MNGGLVLLALAIIALIITVRFLFKKQSPGLGVWIGLAMMFVGAGIEIIKKSPDSELVGAAIFALGFSLFLLRIQFLIAEFRAKSNGSDEIHSRTISDILTVAATRGSLVELLSYSLDRFLEIFSLNSGAIHVYHAARNNLVMGAYRGLSPNHASKLEIIRPGQVAIGRALHSKRVLIIRDLRVSPDYEFFGGKNERYSFLAVVPILVDNECWGVITLLGRKRYQRGMLEASGLEELGRQLGQALQLGKQNRQMAAAYAHQKKLLAFYDRLLSNLYDFDENTFVDQLDWFSENLFGGRGYWVFLNANGGFRLAYSGNGPKRFRRGGEPGRQLSLPIISKSEKPGKIFGIDPNDLTGLLPEFEFKSPALCAVGFSYRNHNTGLLVIDDNPNEISQNYANDVKIINDLCSLLIFAQLRSDSAKPRTATLFESGVSAGELADVFAYLSGNIQLMSNDFADGRFDTARIKKWLNNIDEATAQGIKLLEDIGPGFDPNSIIKSVIDANELQIDFDSDPDIPRLKTDSEDFRNIIAEIFSQAIDNNRRVRVTTRPDGHGKIALTIEGKVNSESLSGDLNLRIDRHNLILKMIPGAIGEYETVREIEPYSTKMPAVLVVENREMLRRLLGELLAGLDYRFVVRQSAVEAISYLDESAKRGDPVGAIIAEMNLDDMPGPRLCQKAKELIGRIHTILIAGWGINISAASLKETGVDAILYKPFRLEQLKQVLSAEGLGKEPWRPEIPPVDEKKS